MPKKPKLEPNDKEQSKRFIETARLLEINEKSDSLEFAMMTVRTPLVTTARKQKKEKI